MNTYKDFNNAIDQKKLLDECIFVVKEQSFYMKQSLENGSLRDTLKYASNMLCELRTSLLSPKHYYELYMIIFNELQHLDNFISDKKKHKKKFIDIYESVQHAGNIIPRLYLLIIVGRNYIKNKDIKAKYILKDMTELCKGIQHPLRGLFLRYFLIQMCKDRIPDTGSEYEEAGGGNIDDAFEFLLTNFYESLKLWSRMNDQTIKIPTLQDDKVVNNRIKVLKEKMDVKMLVGSILVRMSQLEGMTTQYYIEKCLPKLLLYLSNINDSLIQQYIFESIVQVFSDECHIYSLETLLNAVLKINSSLDFKSILITLLKRLRSFIESNKYELPKNIDIFNLFYDNLVLYVNKTLETCTKTKFNSIYENSKKCKLNNGNMENLKNSDNNDIVQNNNDSNNINDNFNNLNSDLNNIINNNNNEIKYNTNDDVGIINSEEYVQNIVKMLQVIYEFIFLCIRIYDNISISKLFVLPYTIVSNVSLDNDLICEQVISIIVLPFSYLGLSALNSKDMQKLLSSVNERHKKKLSLDIIDAIIECKNKSIVYEDVEEILKYISYIFHEKEKKDDVFNLENSSTYTSEKLCKFFHIITNTNNIEQKYNIYMLFYKYIADSSYLIHLLPTIIFSMLNLVTTITNLVTNQSEKKEDNYDDLVEDKNDKISNHFSIDSQNDILDEKRVNQYNMYVKNIFKFIHTNLLSVSSKIPLLAFKLFLYSAVVVNNYNNFLQAYQYISFDNLEAICYEFITQPLIIYEEDINISSQQFDCIIWAVGIMCSHITLLENENYENIALKLTQHASKLLKKKDQCIGVLQCSHLYWENKKYRNSSKVFDCLQKSIKNADIAMQSNSDNIFLFVYMLQKYVYYYEAENIEITEDSLHYLISVCHDYYNQTNSDNIFKQEYKQIVKYIYEKKKNSNLFHKINVDTSILL
ncbi:vacuolar protein sorting-associated protein 35, putative [Plasmodium relictum]|uniref:Vacuolar protein sorting-associated protein 35 n=1 Tax=Plasmodium relictum TaxID=85471 RepID=A0A1J1H4Y4_PLARL|nr:vacuolar protein sorting-associated protein 35, putative [Plasmodium relictum]CRG99975.1 vacuolar protein sorting-associated protein 35, putative [Plasmodium relictum]